MLSSTWITHSTNVADLCKPLIRLMMMNGNGRRKSGSWTPVNLFFLCAACGITDSAILSDTFGPLEDLADKGNGLGFTANLPDSILPAPLEPTTTLPPGPVTNDGTVFFKHYYPNCAGSKSGGQNLLQALDQDQFAQACQDNAHYPFANHIKWQLVKWFTDTSLTQQQIDAFLQLFYVYTPNLYILILVIHFCP